MPVCRPHRPKRCVERSIEIIDAVLYLSRQERLEKPWTTGGTVVEGELMARRANGDPLAAPADGFVIVTNPCPKPFADPCQFGVESGGSVKRS
jgi:hypothetical protein